MKYIRAKNYVYEVVEDITKFVIVKNFAIPNLTGFVLKEDVLAQADTIKNLCDEFVCIFKNKIKLQTSNYESLMDYYKEDKKSIEIIYGAIWTDKGLIYVAKMNDKGELELL